MRRGRGVGGGAADFIRAQTASPWTGRKPGQSGQSTRREARDCLRQDCDALGQSGQSRFWRALGGWKIGGQRVAGSENRDRAGSLDFRVLGGI
jgi:hypothetical protein